jgi:hypothetical protein
MVGMIPLAQFEIEVLRKMTEGILPPGAIDTAIQEGENFKYDYTGYGYYVTFSHPLIPSKRMVCDGPLIVAESNGIEACFVVFLEANQVTFECFPPDGETTIPESYRSQAVNIRIE